MNFKFIRLSLLNIGYCLSMTVALVVVVASDDII